MSARAAVPTTSFTVSASSNNAVVFNGSTQYATSAAFSSISLSSFTLEFWMKENATHAAYSPLACLFSGSTRYMALANDNPADTANVNYVVDRASSDAFCGNSSAVFTPTNWTHFALTYDSSTGNCDVYINGSLMSESFSSPGAGALVGMSNFQVRLGAAFDLGAFTDSTFGMMRLWNTVKTSTQLGAYSTYYINPALHTDLVGNWNFADGSGSTIVNTANPGVGDITLTGSPSWTTGPTLSVYPYGGARTTVSTTRRTASTRNFASDLPTVFPPPPPVAPPPAPPPVDTSKSTVPRGIAISGLEFGASSEQQTFNYFQNKGFNTARLAFKWETLQPDLNGALDAAGKAQLDDQINKATTAGIKIILDCHNYGRRVVRPNGGFTDDFTTSPQATFSVPWSDQDTGAGTLTFRDYGRGMAGTLNNPVSGGGYKWTFQGKFEGYDHPYAEVFLETFRVSDSLKYAFVWNPSSGDWSMRKYVNSTSETILASGNKSVSIGTYYTFVIDIGATTSGKINVSIDGTPMFTTNSVNTDANITRGQVAIWPAGVRFTVKSMTLNIGGDTSSGNATTRTIGDGVLTTAHLADLWSRITSAYINNDTVYGFDIMNEPHDMPVPTSTSNYNTTSTVTLMHQASINAIRAVDTTGKKWILCCIDSWGGVQNFSTLYGTNATPWLTDPKNKLCYSFHYYFDDDHSGTYPIAFKTSNNTNIPSEAAPMMQWAVSKGVNLHCGEYGVPNQSSWLVCLTTFLDLCNQYNVWTNHWAGGDPYTSPTTIQPTNSYTTDRLQMSVVGLTKYLGTLK